MSVIDKFLEIAFSGTWYFIGCFLLFCSVLTGFIELIKTLCKFVLYLFRGYPSVDEWDFNEHK